MITKKPRINITFEKTMTHLFENLARQEHKSIACIIRELALEALELREDLYLSQLAKKLDQNNAKTYSHDEVWK